MSNPVAGPPAPPLAEIGDTVVAKGAVISRSVCGCGARASEWRVAITASAAIAVPKTTGNIFFIDGRPCDGLDAPVASFSSIFLLPRVSVPFVAKPCKSSRINTCKSASKQTTLTPFRMNTYKKTGRGVGAE